jgi:ABC-type glycerol-3-phosphate transport system permease component
LLFLFPFLWVFLTSVRPERDLFTDTFRLLTETITFENYEALLQSPFPRYILNSLIVCIPATVIAVAFSLLAAYSFSRRRFRFRNLLLIVVVISQLFPWVVLITPVYSVFYSLGLVNSFVGLIIAYIAITVPFSLYMLLGYLDSVPRELDEAAKIDGCSTLGIIRRVVLPVAWPGVAATAIYAFAQSWNEFLFALTLMTQNDVKTIPVGLAGFFGEYTTRWGLVMAASVVTTLPTLLIFIMLKRQLVSGLAAGAVK